MATPELRFKDFSNDWLATDLEKICSHFQSGKSITSKDISDSESFPVYGGNGLRGFTGTFTHEGKFILVGRQGALCGNVNLVNGQNYISEHAIAIQANTKNSTDFLAYWLDKMNLNRFSEASAQPGLAVNKLVRFKIILPTLKEQTKIASFLSAVDDKIAQLTQEHELLSEYKKGMMQQLFSQKIRFKADDGTDFGDWKECKLGDIVRVNPKVKSLPESFIYIDLESVKKGQLLIEKNIERQDAPSRAQRLLEKGDVLFQMVRPYQKNNYYFDLDGDYVASTGYAQIRANLCSKFIYYLLHEEMFLDQVMNRCTGTSYPAINSSDLSSIELSTPCVEEQTKIAGFLFAIDQKIENITAQIDQAKEWKKGLLQQMFV